MHQNHALFYLMVVYNWAARNVIPVFSPEIAAVADANNTILLMDHAFVLLFA